MMRSYTHLSQQLRRLDRMQRCYLYELGTSDTEAFVSFNFAPPSLRRRIGMLGFLHKRVLNECHPALSEFLIPEPGHANRYHDSPLDPRWDDVRGHSKLYNTSLYMYILMYNRLPQEVIQNRTVSAFQSQLTRIAKERARGGDVAWRTSYQDCRSVVDFFYP